MTNLEKVQFFLNHVFSNPEEIRSVCDSDVKLYWMEKPMVSGIEGLIKFAFQQIKCFSDFRFHIQDYVIGDDKIAVRLMQSGKLNATWENIGNLGASFHVGETMFFHFNGDKISEIWPLINMEEKKRQLVN